MTVTITPVTVVIVAFYGLATWAMLKMIRQPSYWKEMDSRPKDRITTGTPRRSRCRSCGRFRSSSNS